MKKELVFVAIILFSSLVLAQETVNGNKSVDDIKNILGEEIVLPEWAQVVASVIFYTQEKLNLSNLIILLAVFVWVFLLMIDILRWFSFSKPVKIGLAVATTLLFAVAGVIKFVAEFFFGLGNFLTFLGKWEILKVLFFFVIIFIIYLIISKAIKFAEVKMRIARSQEIGEDIGFAASVGESAEQAYRRKH